MVVPASIPGAGATGMLIARSRLRTECGQKCSRSMLGTRGRSPLKVHCGTGAGNRMREYATRYQPVSGLVRPRIGETCCRLLDCRLT
jgi:hypothetical protein